MPDHLTLTCRRCKQTIEMDLHVGSLDIRPSEGWYIDDSGAVCPQCIDPGAPFGRCRHGLPRPCAMEA